MSDLDSKQKDTYFVAVKVFLEKEGKFYVFKDRFGDWDIPGGRIKKHEFNAPLEEIIRRKMMEELGDGIKYEIGKPVVFMRHERVDAVGGELTRIFAIGYQATLISGIPKMSSQHVEELWADPKTFKPEDYFKGGWLKGIQEYLEIRRK